MPSLDCPEHEEEREVPRCVSCDAGGPVWTDCSTNYGCRLRGIYARLDVCRSCWGRRRDNVKLNLGGPCGMARLSPLVYHRGHSVVAPGLGHTGHTLTEDLDPWYPQSSVSTLITTAVSSSTFWGGLLHRPPCLPGASPGACCAEPCQYNVECAIGSTATRLTATLTDGVQDGASLRS